MTDQPGRTPEERLPAPRPETEALPQRADRFTASPQVHATGGLTPERAARIVRQTGNARWVAFLGVTVVALFVIAYYFYETGLPYGLSTPREVQQLDAQQVTSVERGYDLFQANCARCHGAQGQGGIGPVLHDQEKLFAHLNPTYIKNVLTVGGRYVCGNPNSLMPVWADTNGGPLNYIQIQDIINFIRAPSTQTFDVRDPTTNEEIKDASGNTETFQGWVDPSFAPAPSSSPFPDCWSGNVAGGSAAPSGPAPSIPASAVIGTVVAQNVAYDVKTLTATANQTFGIDFKQEDSGVGGHNIEIKDSGGNVVFDGTVLTDPGETTYVVSGLPAGTYTFQCKIHPIPAMTGTLTVH